MFTTPMKHRSPLLDCIRAVAIIMVVFFHVATRYPAASLDPVAEIFLRYGSKGVDIFFPLSGFLITRYLLTDDPKPGFIGIFFLRRFFRIVPLHFLAVTVYYIGAWHLLIDLDALHRIWINYTFLTGWFLAFYGPDYVPYTITWSLSVEEFAYIVFGLLALFARKRLPAFLIAFAILPVLLKYALVQNGLNIYFLPVARIDSIAIGGVVAWMMKRDAPLLATLPVVFAGLYAMARIDDVMWQTMVYPMISVGTCWVIVIFERLLRDLRNPVLSVGATIGFYSYFTYLVHFFNIYVIFAAIESFGIAAPPFWVMAVICFAVTHVQAMVSYHVSEWPSMPFGKSLAPKAWDSLRRIGIADEVIDRLPVETARHATT